MNVNDTATLVYLIAGAFALALGGFAWYSVYVLRGRHREAVYDAQLEELIDGFSDEEELLKADHGRNLAEKWDIHWKTIAKSSGVAAYAQRENNAPTHALILMVVTFLVATVLTVNPVVGILASAAVTVGLSFFLKQNHTRKTRAVNDHLPGFLFALKSNIEANQTPQRAILKIVDRMPPELRDDLIVVKQKILANSTFEDALKALIAKTNSSELKFLASCLIQASASGANIEPQIDTIQDILEQRREAANELDRAVKATLPSVWVGSFTIPLMFAFAYFTDPVARDFWLRDPLSYVALLIVVALYGIGMFITRKMVNNIRNL